MVEKFMKYYNQMIVLMLGLCLVLLRLGTISHRKSKFQCLCDTDEVYIGKTKRHLTARVREHVYLHSAIFNHLQLCFSRCRDNFSCNRFKILDHGRDDFETTIEEALYIKYPQSQSQQTVI